MSSIPRDSDLLGLWPGYRDFFFLSGFLSVYKEASQVAQAVKNLPTNAGEARDTCLIPWVGKIPLE